MARAADGDRSEIDGQNVEGCFRAAHDCSGHAREDAVGSVRGNQLGENTQASATAERTHQGHGQEFRGEADEFEHRIERAAEHVDPACSAEHADGHEDGDKERDDAQGNLETFLRAFDKFLVHGDASQRRIERKEREKERNGEDRQCLHVGCKPSAISVVSSAGRLPDEVEKEDAKDGEEQTRTPTERVGRGRGQGVRLLGVFFVFGRFIRRGDRR